MSMTHLLITVLHKSLTGLHLDKFLSSSLPFPAVPYTEEAIEDQNYGILCAQGCVLFDYSLYNVSRWQIEVVQHSYLTRSP